VLVSTAFAELARYIYVDVLGPRALFAYMGVRVLPETAGVRLLFLVMAVLPSLWLPVHLRRPTDVPQLFLYYAVHIPTCVLLPVVSYSSLPVQVAFAGAILLGFLALEVRFWVPLLPLPRVGLTSAGFWGAFAALYVFALAVFAKSGYLSVSNLRLLGIYGQRMELASRLDEIGALFFYLANWTGGAIAPFAVIAGLHRRKLLLVLAGVAIAAASFVASSNRAAFMGIPPVIAIYALLRKMKGRHLGPVLGAGFLGLTVALRLVDLALTVPMASWTIFHRTFTNNGFLSAIYLDLFEPPVRDYYAHSFLQWAGFEGLPASPAALAGASFTAVPDVHANANLWADAYANLGYAGLALAAASLLAVFWLFDALGRRKDPAVVGAALMVPASALANTSVHTAVVSNGIVIVFLLLWLWNGADRRVARRRPRVRGTRAAERLAAT
jgi:hypothetical protein